MLGFVPQPNLRGELFFSQSGRIFGIQDVGFRASTQPTQRAFFQSIRAHLWDSRCWVSCLNPTYAASFFLVNQGAFLGFKMLGFVPQPNLRGELFSGNQRTSLKCKSPL
uniref:Uncharacterized protein n=1 Tax=Desertifilum tharense IPPAS B-1220 TaxID=1781255 RepID=A0A1E5QJ79_9CYAN|nr:hypothetical protein BH720_13300 [Desertifilum tharense IPPAS B-1220]